MKSVHICGLFRDDLCETDVRMLHHGGSQVWTFNDWYRCYPWMCPDRVFNLHFHPHVTEGDGERFPGDWKARYNDVIRSGGKVSVVEVIDGVDICGQELLPLVLFQRFSRSAVGCGVSAAICLAIHLEFDRIELHGVRLRDAEYDTQVNFVRNAIRHATTNGVQVINPYEQEWSRHDDTTVSVNWNNARDVSIGSLKHLVAYSMGMKLDDNLNIDEDEYNSALDRRRRIR